MRRVCYVTGTRADYGLMRRTLAAIAADPRLDLSVLVTGMHLDPAYGSTVEEICADGHRILAEVPVPLRCNDGAETGANLGRMIVAFSGALAREKPEIVLLLGDRAEMLAGAIAATHQGIAVAHVHGGERSGTLDESVRHAITKLAHIHLAATEDSAGRIVRMGEAAAHVHAVGAPGLDGLEELAERDRASVAAEFGFDLERPIALLLFHPENSDGATGASQMRTVLGALHDGAIQTVALLPNSDAGSAGIRDALQRHAPQKNLALRTHLPRALFVALMARADAMVGNSSAGIIEAATFGTPVVNLGSRQTLRERNPNVVDVPIESRAIADAIAQALERGRYGPENVYGDGRTADRIVALLASYELGPDLLEKVNAY